MTDTSNGMTTDTAPPPEVAEAPDMLEEDIPQGADTFDRQYVEKLRNEARGYRQRAKAAEETAQKYQVFEQFPESDQQVWTQMAGAWLENPSQSASMMQRIAQGVLGDPNATEEEKAEAVQDVAEVAQAEDDPRITQDQVDQLVEQKLAAREEEQQRKAGVEQVHQELSAAGFDRGSLDSYSVLWIA